MGKTTNSLLAAGEMALEGRVDVQALRTLHFSTCDAFDLPDNTRNEVTRLLDECEDMLNGVRLIQELSPKSLDQLVSYGERCSVRIMAARLNQLGVPAQAFDAWDVGVFTDDTYGDAKLLPDTIDSIRDKFSNRIDPDVVAVVTGFIGKLLFYVYFANKLLPTYAWRVKNSIVFANTCLIVYLLPYEQDIIQKEKSQHLAVEDLT